MCSNANNPRIVEWRDGYCVVGPDKICLSISHLGDLDSISEFEVRDSDTIVAAFPYSGSPLMAEMVWLLKNNFDYAELKNKKFAERIPCFESLPVTKRYPERKFSEAYTDSLSYSSKLNDPRCMITHLPFSMLPSGISAKLKHPKLIHVYRHPAEVCRDYYGDSKILTNTTMTFPVFSKEFMKGGSALMGPFWKHVLGYWETRNDQDILFVKCEDMLLKLPAVITSVAKFLDVNVSVDQMLELLLHLSEFIEKIPLTLHTSVDTPSGSSTDTSAAGSTKAVLTKPINDWFDIWCGVKTNKSDFDWKRKL